MRRLAVFIHFMLGHKCYTLLPEGRHECQDCGVILFDNEMPQPLEDDWIR